MIDAFRQKLNYCTQGENRSCTYREKTKDETLILLCAYHFTCHGRQEDFPFVRRIMSDSSSMLQLLLSTNWHFIPEYKKLRSSTTQIFLETQTYPSEQPRFLELHQKAKLSRGQPPKTVSLKGGRVRHRKSQMITRQKVFCVRTRYV